MSFFWYNATAGYRELNLRQLWGSLLVNPTKEVNLLPSNYLIALGTRNENTTKDNTCDSVGNRNRLRNHTSAINVTGEIHSPLK